MALLAEMLKVLIRWQDIMQDEVNPFGLEINWCKTRIQTTTDTSGRRQVQVDGNTGKVIDEHLYSPLNGTVTSKAPTLTAREPHVV